MSTYQLRSKLLLSLLGLCILPSTQAGTPLWTFTPLTPTAVTVTSTEQATIQYLVTNQSRKTHRLALTPVSGINQVTAPGNCPNLFTLGYQQSCILTLQVVGAALTGHITSGPRVCQDDNPLLCYQPSQANSLAITLNPQPGPAILTASVSSLALSVACAGTNTACAATNNALTGHTRQIIITNTGGTPATNLAVSSLGLPTGTVISSSTCNNQLNPGSSCTIMITPGAIASADISNNACTSGTPPVPGTVTMTADGQLSSSTALVVLGYGCQYQAGFVFSVDDTTPVTGSIGGKVAALANTISIRAGGIYWEGENIAVGPTVWENNAIGVNDGKINTATIIDVLTTQNGIFLPSYAAGQCRSYATDNNGKFCTTSAPGCYSDWYLPAICELGPFNHVYDSVQTFPGAARCIGTNIQEQLFDTNIPNVNLLEPGFDQGLYWSSNEFSGNPPQGAWYQAFSPPSVAPSYQGYPFKTDNGPGLGIRCVRTLTP